MNGLNTDLLWRIGEALWGPAWMTRLAAELDVNPRSVRRWAGGNGHLPAELHPKLIEVMRQRGEALDGLVAELEGKRC